MITSFNYKQYLMQDLLSKGEKFAVNNLRLNFTEEGKFPYLMGILFRVSYLGLDV